MWRSGILCAWICSDTDRTNSGGDRVQLISGENEIRNCVIHDINRSRASYKPSVKADSIGLVIQNNTFYNSIHQMIAINNNNVKIAYNEFYNCTSVRETIPGFENFPMDKIGPGGNG